MSIKRTFTKYVTENILGMIGISLYILADTFFISKAAGADGITALNLVLPVYSLIFAIGLMIGVGSAIRFRIERSRKNAEAEFYFFNALFFTTVISLIFILSGIFIPEKVLMLMGADVQIIRIGKSYIKIVLMFAPCFMWNYVCNAFVRNDGEPTKAMFATLVSSLFNIVMDYVLMFPLGMGMSGAALATSVSPILGILICCSHFFSEKNTVRLKFKTPSFRRLFSSCKVGMSAFIGEMSAGVTTVTFNMLILGLTGNIGVAAYGVVANISLIAAAIFNGIAQGVQPLLSEAYGKGERTHVKQLIGYAMKTAIVLAVFLIFIVWLQAAAIAGIFNSEHSEKLLYFAEQGLRICFIGFLFAGINIAGCGMLSAVDEAKWAFVASVMRGLVVIVPCACLLAGLFGMNGVWMAFPVSEAITCTVVCFAMKRIRKK